MLKELRPTGVTQAERHSVADRIPRHCAAVPLEVIDRSGLGAAR